MPYYVHPSGEDPVATARVCFTSAVHARAAKQDGEVVTFVVNDIELNNWQARELNRFEDNTYIKVPWSDYHYDEAGYYLRHFAHLSLKFAGRVAFTKSMEHGTLDRQTVMRPGRYLEQYLSGYSRDQRAKWIGIVSSLESELKIARTSDDIETVYVGGPNSCMSHRADAYSTSCHPVRVYGDSDLGVAYIGDIDAAKARAIVWPDKKIYGRIYGNEAVMTALLEQAEFVRSNDYNDWTGAKLRYIENDRGAYVMPYLDIAEAVNIKRVGDKRWFVVAGYDGDYTARNTDGRTGDVNTCEHCGTGIDEDSCYCDSCLDNSCTCPDCDERHWDDNRDGYCDGCYEHYCTCDRCDELVHNDNSHYLSMQDITICDSCHEDTRECEVCEETFLEESYPRATRVQRVEELKHRVCNSCQRNGAFICKECDAAIAGGKTCEDCEKDKTDENVEPEEVLTCAS